MSTCFFILLKLRKIKYPILIQQGTRDLLCTQVQILASKYKECGVPLELQLHEGMPHVFQMIPYLPEVTLCVFDYFLKNIRQVYTSRNRSFLFSSLSPPFPEKKKRLIMQWIG